MESLTQSQIRQRLKSLRSEHQKLDILIAQEMSSSSLDQIRVCRLKKHKLAIKDEITRLENMLLPDIIA
ncbi:MAG: DUF465 domain-containing protein [Alphaproteobacteria bacterium]|nr:DUF465 domain-containing protein [Alphaproteobacteria bacterium]MBO4644213.1 DUF465 domain-containing protein [Alphaproteobacteria bacterium]